MSKHAIISVYDKTDLLPFAQFLSESGYTILSTGGSAKYLVEQKVPVTFISDYTGQPEILDGRVKSLHPRIHGGILARRDRADDLAQLQQAGIGEIDFVVVNLYPFAKKVAELEQRARERNGQGENESLVELIDIGGPTMIRAAAKNSHDVVPVSDPADYPGIMAELKSTGSISLETRQRLASKVFAMMAAYDGAIARYFALNEKLFDEKGKKRTFGGVETVVLKEVQALRYGENPHQSAGLYRRYSPQVAEDKPWWTQVQGKELSYNNLLDMYATIDLYLELRQSFPKQAAAVIVKHNNPCGAALRPSAIEAFRAARDCDPVSAFGGIVAVSGEIDEKLASTILEGFVEVVIAEAMTPGARSEFQKKKNVRVIECHFETLLRQRESGVVTLRNFGEDFLLQSADNALARVQSENVVSGSATPAQLADFEFAWAICKHVKSNTIVLSKDLQAIGIGAGQMSRVDAARLSLDRAALHGHKVNGAVAASDAFLPFPDTLEVLNDGGVVGLIQPGGSVKDGEVTEVAKKRGVVMVMTGERHFRH